MNLKILQNSLTQLKINVHFDIGRVAQEKFAENLALVCSLYKHLNCEEMKEDSVSSYTTSQQSYKRSSDTLFQS